MRRALVMLVLAGVLACAGPPAAGAAVVVRADGGLTLESTGDPADETVTLSEVGGKLIVDSPQGLQIEGDCEGEGSVAECTLGATGTVSVRLGDGQDTLEAATLERAVIVELGDGGDTVTTGAGDDAITVVGAGNRVSAGPGGDILSGPGELRGEAGDDWLSGGGRLEGGPGRDRLIAVEGIVSGGPDVDSVEFSLSGPVRITLDGVANDGVGAFLAANVLPDVEILRGGPYDDVLRATGGSQVLEGGGGADVLDGGAGRDELAGGEGDDRLESRDGEADVASCGAGEDAITADLLDRIDADCERRDLPAVAVAAAEDDEVAPLPAVPLLLQSPLAPATIAADVGAPVVQLALARRIARSRLARRGIVTRVTCSEACAVAVALRLDARAARRLRLPRTLARAAAGSAGAVAVKPRAAVGRRLARARGGTLRAVLSVTVRDAAGNARTVSRTLRLTA